MFDGLLAALAGVPSLPGASCRGRPHLFDGTDGPDGPRTQQAAALCHRCPALERCSEWAEAQPLRSLSGVIAGRLFVHVAHESQRKWPQGMVIGDITAGPGVHR